jgi:hypothetical protein
MSEQRVIETLEAHGCSWQDYILLGEPADVSICRWSPGSGLSALVIEDDALWHEAIQFLTQRGVRRFTSVEDVKRALDT